MTQGLPIAPAPALARPGPAIVVIGAGLGGLAAALRLAHAGARVTVVERHAAPGGKMRQLPSAAGPVDAGPTVLTMRGVFDALFADVGERIGDHVSLLAEPLLARHFWPDGGQLDLWDDRAANRAAIAAFAGDRAVREFDAFSDRAARLFAAFEGPVMQAPRLDAGRLTARVLGDPRLFAAMAPGRSCAGCCAAPSPTNVWRSSSRAMPPMSAGYRARFPRCSRSSGRPRRAGSGGCGAACMPWPAPSPIAPRRRAPRSSAAAARPGSKPRAAGLPP
jgi:NAD(P)-dependent dehydrogenase (short-subunit alcohol dehydrogenase family)